MSLPHGIPLFHESGNAFSQVLGLYVDGQLRLEIVRIT
jgi:hypothetical protein